MSNDKLPPSFYEIFDRSLPRLGPGDACSTQKAIRRVVHEREKQGASPSDAKIRVLDIGCGNGPQTIELAKLLDTTILAVDNHQPFLDELQHRAEAEGVAEKIDARLEDMHNLGQKGEDSFDLIWAEGSFFVMGVREALTMCHRLLVPQGLLAMSELTWLDSDPPAPCRQFFDEIYPAMADVATNLKMMEACGFEILDHFSLPELAWDQFYRPLEDRLRLLSEKYASDHDKLAMFEAFQMEIDIRRDYYSFYSNEFYLLKNR